MAAYEQRDNSGTLFKNENREKETHANARGKAMIGGVMYYVDAWTKEGAKGKFQSLSFKPIEQQSAPAAKPQRISTPDNFEDSDIPF